MLGHRKQQQQQYDLREGTGIRSSSRQQQYDVRCTGAEMYSMCTEEMEQRGSESTCTRLYLIERVSVDYTLKQGQSCSVKWERSRVLELLDHILTSIIHPCYVERR